MKKRKIFLIIEAFCSVFPELQLDAKEKQQILNQGMNYDTLIIVPSVSPEKLMFLMEEVIEISSFIMPNQFFSLLDLNRRREEGLYVLYLNEALGEKDESLTFAFLYKICYSNYSDICEDICSPAVKIKPQTNIMTKEVFSRISSLLRGRLFLFV